MKITFAILSLKVTHVVFDEIWRPHPRIWQDPMCPHYDWNSNRGKGIKKSLGKITLGYDNHRITFAAAPLFF